MVGPANDANRAVAAYHRFLVWDIERSPWLTRALEWILGPLIGKSLVLYFEKPLAATTSRVEAERPREVVAA